MRNGRLAIEDRQLRTLFGIGTVGHLSDGQLLERFDTLHGEAAELAFAALVERHGSMVLRVARAILRDEHGANDAFQATFLLLARKARSLWVRDSLGPWLHAVACRVASHERTLEARRRKFERIAAGQEASQARVWEHRELGRAIHQEIDRLPERYRSAVVLCHLEGLTQHEAARRLGWPVGTLQSRLARGRDQLRDRLGRRGLAPTIGAFPPLAIPDALVAVTARAASASMAGGPVVGVIAPAVLAMIEATSKGMLMTKLKLGTMGVLILLVAVAASTASRGMGSNPKPADPQGRVVGPGPAPLVPIDGGDRAEPVRPEAEPGLTLSVVPRPWQTVVRVKIQDSDLTMEFNSGTIIQSTDSHAIILTEAHFPFFAIKEIAPRLRSFESTPIRVDLFDGELTGRQPAGVLCSVKDLPAVLLDSDQNDDLCLIQIRTNRRLPAALVAPSNWPFVKGSRMCAVGCSFGRDATAWDTTLLDFWVQPPAGHPGASSSAFKCSYPPKPGRTGGGLFTTEGFLAGVCTSSDPVEGVGYYASPGPIHRLLDRNGLTKLYLPGYQAPEVARGALPERSPLGPVGGSDASEPSGSRPGRTARALSEPDAAPVESDRDRRLSEVERKLDQIIEALKTIKGDFSLHRR